MTGYALLKKERTSILRLIVWTFLMIPLTLSPNAYTLVRHRWSNEQISVGPTLNVYVGPTKWTTIIQRWANVSVPSEYQPSSTGRLFFFLFLFFLFFFWSYSNWLVAHGHISFKQYNLWNDLQNPMSGQLTPNHCVKISWGCSCLTFLVAF